MREIIIGDVHGCCHELKELLARMDLCVDTDRLILLGDLMDRGPDSCEVYHLAADLERRMRDRFVLIRGSHEELLLQEHPRIMDRLLWHIVGKGATMRSFRRSGEQLCDAVPWFQDHCVIAYESRYFQCVHAGIREERISTNDPYTLVMDHRIARENRYSGKLTVIGHIHERNPVWFDGSGNAGHVLQYHVWSRLPEIGVICLDTRCPEGGKLTGMEVIGDRYRLEYVESCRHRRAETDRK